MKNEFLPDDNPMLDLEEVGKLTSLKVTTLRRWIRRYMDGEKVDIFPFVKVGGRYYASMTDVQEWYKNKFLSMGFNEFSVPSKKK